jgi:hypothetical protein
VCAGVRVSVCQSVSEEERKETRTRRREKESSRKSSRERESSRVRERENEYEAEGKHGERKKPGCGTQETHGRVEENARVQDAILRARSGERSHRDPVLSPARFLLMFLLWIVCRRVPQFDDLLLLMRKARPNQIQSPEQYKFAHRIMWGFVFPREPTPDADVEEKPDTPR